MSKHEGYPSPRALLLYEAKFTTKYKLQVTGRIRVLHPRQGVRQGVRPCREAVIATPNVNFVRDDA